MVVRGVCVGFGVAIWETMLMELVPDHLLSRVVSLDYFGSFGLMPLGLAFAAGVVRAGRPGDADRNRGGDGTRCCSRSSSAVPGACERVAFGGEAAPQLFPRMSFRACRSVGASARRSRTVCRGPQARRPGGVSSTGPLVEDGERPGRAASGGSTSRARGRSGRQEQRAAGARGRSSQSVPARCCPRDRRSIPPSGGNQFLSMRRP